MTGDYWLHWINALRDGKGTLPELMRDILRKTEAAWPCESGPKPDWPMLQALDFGGEFERLSARMETVFTVTPPEAEINGLAFRIGYPDPGSTDETVRLAVSGSRFYDNHGWTLTLDWVNPGCVQDSPLLTTVFREIACGVPYMDHQREKAFQACYHFIALTVAAWRYGRLGRTLLGSAPSRGIFIGVDAWMGISLKPLTAEEFAPDAPGRPLP
jgi:hypothetical protein